MTEVKKLAEGKQVASFNNFDFPGTYQFYTCLLYTSDAADERSSVDLGGRRIIKKKTKGELRGTPSECI